MEITLCCPTYKRFDLCIDMIQSALAGSVVPDRIIILDNGAGKFSEYVTENNIDLPDTVGVIVAPYNLGVARGWNALITIVQNMYPESLAVVVNDDLLLDERAIETLREAAFLDYAAHGAYSLVYCAGGIDAPNAFSFFMVHPKTFFDTIGRFDETIYPAYHEDGDIHQRMKLAGYDLTRVDGVLATHREGGSATLKSYNAEEEKKHHHEFRRNAHYFLLKWGGDPGNETFKFPFNNMDIAAIMNFLKQNYGF